MWMTAGVVWQFEFDRSAGEHHEREGGFGAVEAVGASDEQPDPRIDGQETDVVSPDGTPLGPGLHKRYGCGSPEVTMTPGLLGSV